MLLKNLEEQIKTKYLHSLISESALTDIFMLNIEN